MATFKDVYVCNSSTKNNKNVLTQTAKERMLNIIIVWFVLFVLDPGDVLVKGKESIKQLGNFALTFDQIFKWSKNETSLWTSEQTS